MYICQLCISNMNIKKQFNQVTVYHHIFYIYVCVCVWKWISVHMYHKPLQQSHKEVKSSLQYKLHQMKNQLWLDISKENQKVYNCNYSKALDNLIWLVFSPQSSSAVALKSKDGSSIFKDIENNMKQ